MITRSRERNNPNISFLKFDCLIRITLYVIGPNQGAIKMVGSTTIGSKYFAYCQ